MADTQQELQQIQRALSHIAASLESIDSALQRLSSNFAQFAEGQGPPNTQPGTYS